SADLRRLDDVENDLLVEVDADLTADDSLRLRADLAHCALARVPVRLRLPQSQDTEHAVRAIGAGRRAAPAVLLTQQRGHGVAKEVQPGVDVLSARERHDPYEHGYPLSGSMAART